MLAQSKHFGYLNILQHKALEKLQNTYFSKIKNVKLNTVGYEMITKMEI